MESEKSSAFPVLPLFLLVTIFYLNFVGRVVLAPLLPLMEADLRLNHGKAGTLFLFLASGYGAGLLVCGFVSSFLNHRRTVIFSALIVGGALLAISWCASIRGIQAGLVVVGVSSGLYLPSGIATVTSLLPKEQWGKGMTLHELAPNLGFVTAPLLAEALLKFSSWRGILAIIGAGSLLMGTLYLPFGRGGRSKGVPLSIQSMREILFQPSFWIMSILFAISIGSSMGLYSMLPLFLVSEIGLERGWANALVGFSRGFGLIVLFFSGIISGRWGPQKSVTVLLAGVASLILLLGMIHGPVISPVILYLQAAAAACLFPIAFTIIALLFPASLRAAAIALIIFFGFIIGGGIIPLGIGYWADHFSFTSGFLILGAVSLIFLPLFFRLRGHLNPPEH